MLKPYQKAQLTFDLLDEIGHDGKNSRTYIAYDHQLNANIVIKQLSKEKLASTGELFAESKALYAGSHPNVVQIHYACEDDDNVYLAMPYYTRGSVKSIMKERFLTVREIVSIGCQILSGLHNIHSKKLIHFDIKPDNILFSDRGEALLSDFGQAKQMNNYGVAIQSRLYNRMVAPEVTTSLHLDLRFDIYQVGLTLYRMCNGPTEFDKQFKEVAKDRDTFLRALQSGAFPDRKKFPLHIPTKLQKIVKKCLEVDLTKRFQSAIDVANALATIEGNLLDWQYDVTDGIRSWNKNVAGTNLVFRANGDGSTHCEKAVNGQARRVTAGCKPTMLDKEIYNFLESN